MTNIRWKSGVNGNWATAADWVGGVPGSSDAVNIAASGHYTVTINHSEAAQSITLNAAGATLAESGKNVTLTLGTGLTVSAGTLSLVSSLGGPDTGFSSTQLITGGFLDISSKGVLSLSVPSGNGSSQYSTQVNSGVDLEGTTNLGTQTALYLTGGGELGGTIAGPGELFLTGSYIADTASFSGLGQLEVGNGGLYFTTTSGTLATLSAYDGSTLSVASGLTVTVASDLTIGLGIAIFSETTFTNVISGPGTLVTSSAAKVHGNKPGVTELTVGGGLTWINSGQLTIDGGVAVNQSQGDSFTLINQAGGTVLFEQPGGFSAAQTGTDLFTNAGDLDSSGDVTIAIQLDSTGVIDPEGTLTLSGGGTLGGGLDDTGTLLLTGAYALAAGGLSAANNLGAGNLALNDGVLSVGSSSTFAGCFGTDGGNDEIILASGADLTLSAAVTIGQTAAQNPDLYIVGPGTLSTLGTTTLLDAGSGVSLIGEGTWINGGTVSDSARISLGDTTGTTDVETIVNQAGATFGIVGPDGGIVINGDGTGVFDNVGTLTRGTDSGTSTLAAALDSTGIIDVTSGTLALTGGGTITGELDGAGTLLLSAGHFVVTSPLSGNGHLVVGAGASVTTETLLAGGGTLSIAAGHTTTYTGALGIGSPSGGYTISGPGTLSTPGTTSVYDGGAGALELVLSGGLSWKNGGTVNDAGFGYAAYPGGSSATITNSGTFNFNSDDASLTVYDTTTTDIFTNTGTLAKTVGTGTSLLGLKANDTGTIAVASGTLALSGGGLVSGVLTGAGLLDLAAGSFTTTHLSGAGHLGVTGNGTTLAESATGTLAASVLVSGGATLSGLAKADVMTLSGQVAFGDTSGYGALSGPGTIATSGTTSVFDGGAGVLELVAVGGVTWANVGTVNDAGFGYAAYPGGSGAAVVNSGTFDFTSDDASLTVYDTTTSNTFTNTGTLGKSAGTGTSLLGLAVHDTGAVAVASGTLALSGGGLVSGSLSGAGLLDLVAGSFTSTGLSGAGHLAVTGNGTTLAETATGTIAASVLVSGGGTLATSLKTAVLTVSGPVMFGDASGYGALSGPGTVSTVGMTSVLDGGAEVLKLVLAGGVTWANAGTVNDAGFGYAAYPGGSGAAVANSGIFDFTSDDASLTIYDTSTTDLFTNTGTLAKTAGTGTSLLGLAIKDTGTVSVQSGTLALAGGGQVSGSLSGAGLLDLAAGAFTSTGLSGAGHLAVTGNGTTLGGTASGTIASAVSVSGDGTLSASPTVNLALSGNVTLGDATGYGAFSGPGTISTAGTTSIFDGGATALELVASGGVNWANSGLVADAGFGYAAYPGGSGATIVNSGTFDFTSDDASLTIYDTSTTDTFINTGLLAKTVGAGTSLIGLAVRDTGSVAVASGTLALTGGGQVSGTLTGAGLLDLAGGTFNSTGLSGAGHLAVTGNATTLSETVKGTIASAVLVSGGGTLGAASGNGGLTLSGQVTLGDASGFGAFSGPGTISTAGTTGIFDGGQGVLQYAVENGVTWANSGTVDDAGSGYVAYPGGPGGATILNSGSFDFTSDDASLTIYDSNSTDLFTNTGTLAKTAGTGTSLLNLAIRDSGSTAVASGTLALAGGGLVSGALSGTGVLNLAAGTFTSTGLSGAGHLAVSGSATTLIVTASGTIADAVLVSGGATLSVAPSATLTLTGPVMLGDASGFGGFGGTGTIVTTGATLLPDLGAGGLAADIDGGVTWINKGVVSAGGQAYLSASSTIDNVAGGVFDLTTDDAGIALNQSAGGTGQINNAGLLAKTGGTLTSTISVGLTNTGTIEAAHGTLAFTGSLAGSGTLRIDAGATLDLGGTIPASQKITFDGGAAATLKLESPASIGTLTAFTAGDRLDLVGLSVTSAKVSGNTLTVVSASGTNSFVSAGLAGEVAAVTKDGTGGSFVTLYRGAAPTHMPEPLAFGHFHVGSTAGTLLGLTVTNNAAADGYSEKLSAGFGGATSGFSAGGTVSGLAGGASNSTSLTATISTGSAGAKSGTATLTLASNGTGIDGRGSTTLPSQVVNLTGAVYNYAAGTLAGSTLNLGIIHAGTAAGAALTLTNSAAAGGYSEALDAGLFKASAGLSAVGTISLLAAGQTDSTTLLLSVDTGTTGAYSGSATLGLVSDGAGTSGLGNTALASQTVTVTATVDNYALATLQDPGGPALTGASTHETLNLGSVGMGGTALSASIGVLNSATGLADLLGGSFASTGAAGFTNTGLGSFTALSAGKGEHAQSVSLATGAAGVFTETVVLSSYGTNASGYHGALAAETLTIVGTVTASSGMTHMMASGTDVIHGSAGLFIAGAGLNVDGSPPAGHMMFGAGPATIMPGRMANSLAAGTGDALTHNSAKFAGAFVADHGHATCDGTNAAGVTLGGVDSHFKVHFDSAGKLNHSGLAFITGSGVVPTLTASGGTHMPRDGGGMNTQAGLLDRYDGLAGTAAGLNGDTSVGWTASDLVDFGRLSAAAVHWRAAADGPVISTVDFVAGSSLHDFTMIGAHSGSGLLIGLHS